MAFLGFNADYFDASSMIYARKCTYLSLHTFHVRLEKERLPVIIRLLNNNYIPETLYSH